MRLGMTTPPNSLLESLGEFATARGVNARRNGCERTAILAIIVGVGSARSTGREAVTTLIGSRRGVGASVIRIVIVEDHPAIAEGLTALLSIESDLTVVGVARDCDAADRLIAAQSPDVVLCDIRLAGTGDGLELLARRPAGPAFIMLSSYSYPSYVVAAVEHGAKGYLSKMATIEQIVASVRTVAAGATAFPSDVRRTVRTALRPPHAARSADSGTRGRRPGQRRDRRATVTPPQDDREPAATDVRPLRRYEPDLPRPSGSTPGLDQGQRLAVLETYRRSSSTPRPLRLRPRYAPADPHVWPVADVGSDQAMN